MRNIRILSHISDHRTDQSVDQIQTKRIKKGGKFLKGNVFRTADYDFRKLPIEGRHSGDAEHSAMNIAVQSVQKEKWWKREDHTAKC